MIALAGLLVLVAGALLVGGLGNGQTAMLWGSVGVSALAAVALVLSSVRRSRAARAAAEDDDGPVLVAAAAPAAAAPAARAEQSPAVEAGPAETTVVAPRAPAAPVEPAESEPADEPASATVVPVAAERDAEVPEAVVPEAVAPPTVPGPSTGSHAVRRQATPVEDGEPAEEDVEVTDLLLVLDLTDEVVVVDEHPRYHLAGCSQTAGEEEFALPLTEARADGFTACGICRPDRHLADAERRRRAAAKA